MHETCIDEICPRNMHHIDTRTRKQRKLDILCIVAVLAAKSHQLLLLLFCLVYIRDFWDLLELDGLNQSRIFCRAFLEKIIDYDFCWFLALADSRFLFLSLNIKEFFRILCEFIFPWDEMKLFFCTALLRNPLSVCNSPGKARPFREVIFKLKQF